MRLLKTALLLCILPLLAFGTLHKFYVSVTNINYSEKDQSLQITSRIFIDDLQAVLLERYGKNTHLATEKEAEVTDELVAKYMEARFSIMIDGKEQPFRFLGKKYDNDVAVCYLEVPDIHPSAGTPMEVRNELLTDLYEEQQNLVHFKIGGVKKSFVLVRERTNGVLNWPQ